MWNKATNITKLTAAQPGWLWRLVLLCLGVLLVTAVLVLILFAEALNLDAVGRRLRYGSARGLSEYGSFTFEPHSTNRFSLFDRGVAAASFVGLEIYDEDGTAALHLDQIMEESALQEGNRLLLHYDVGGTELALVHPDDGVVLTLQAAGGFYDADLSAGDALCTASSESGYKTVLRVYNREQKEIYRWFSASRFMPLCAVSPDAASMAAVSLGQQDGSFESTLYFFSTRAEEPVASVSLGDELVYDLRFVSDDRLCAVTEAGLRWFDAKGSETAAMDVQTGYLSRYDLEGDGFAVVQVNLFQSGDQSTVLAVNEKGEELGSFPCNEEILDLSANGKYIAVLTARKLTVFRRDLTVYAECANTFGASTVLMRADGTAYLLSDGAARLFIP